MPFTCPQCGRYWSIYNESHSPGSEECLFFQFADAEAARRDAIAKMTKRIEELEKANKKKE